MCKFEAFRRLHQGGAIFVIPNPWDIGSAKILAAAGFKALATTSAGFAYSQGLADHEVGQEAMLTHCSQIVEAIALPVSADLGRGFGDSPDAVSETIALAASVGLAGCSIEDYSGNPDSPIFEFDVAVERIVAACEAKRSLDHDFVLTARCDNYASGIRDLDDTIRRLQAYEEAGADVLYPPALDDLSEIKTLCEAVSKPVNIVVEALTPSVTINDLAAAGVTRVSLGSAMYLAAIGGLQASVSDIKDAGSLKFLSDVENYETLEELFSK